MATAVTIVVNTLLAAGAVVLFGMFVLALRSSDAANGREGAEAPVAGRATATGFRAYPRPVPDSTIVYVYGPPEVAAALRADLTAAAMAAGLEGVQRPVEVIIDGLDGGQRKVVFVDLR